MIKTTPVQNKELVLQAFDTLFNKRDYKAAERYCGVPTESDIVGVPQKRRRSRSAVSATLMAVAVLLAGCDGKRASDAPPAPVVCHARISAKFRKLFLLVFNADLATARARAGRTSRVLPAAK